MEKIHFKNGLPYAGEASKVIRPIHMIIIMTMMNWWAWSKPKCCEYFQVGKNALLSRFHFAPAVTLIVCHKYWVHITPHLPLPMVACTPKNYCHMYNTLYIQKRCRLLFACKSGTPAGATAPPHRRGREAEGSLGTSPTSTLAPSTPHKPDVVYVWFGFRRSLL